MTGCALAALALRESETTMQQHSVIQEVNEASRGDVEVIPD